MLIYIFPKQILSRNLCHPIAVLIDNTYFSLKFLQIILAYCNKDRIGVLSFSVIVFLFVLPHAVHTYLCTMVRKHFQGSIYFSHIYYISYFLCIFIIYLAHPIQQPIPKPCIHTFYKYLLASQILSADKNNTK